MRSHPGPVHQEDRFWSPATEKILLAAAVPKSPSCSPPVTAEQTFPVGQVLSPRTSCCWPFAQHPSMAFQRCSTCSFLPFPGKELALQYQGSAGVSRCADAAVLFASVPERSTERSAACACQRHPVPAPPPKNSRASPEESAEPALSSDDSGTVFL